jgi:serine/threonine protein kinase
MSRTQRLSDKMIWSLLSQMVSALYYLHEREKPILHRDISPDNILIDMLIEDKELLRIVLSDYDTVREIEGTQLQTKTGKLGYWAPEVDKGEQYGTRADIWSLGVVVYELMTGTNPMSVVSKIKCDNSERDMHATMKIEMQVRNYNLILIAI